VLAVLLLPLPLALLLLALLLALLLLPLLLAVLLLPLLVGLPARRCRWHCALSSSLLLLLTSSLLSFRYPQCVK
jgi:hypothetical protein